MKEVEMTFVILYTSREENVPNLFSFSHFGANGLPPAGG